jgi:hypothetical protein
MSDQTRSESACWAAKPGQEATTEPARAIRGPLATRDLKIQAASNRIF